MVVVVDVFVVDLFVVVVGYDVDDWEVGWVGVWGDGVVDWVNNDWVVWMMEFVGLVEFG